MIYDLINLPKKSCLDLFPNLVFVCCYVVLIPFRVKVLHVQLAVEEFQTLNHVTHKWLVSPVPCSEKGLKVSSQRKKSKYYRVILEGKRKQLQQLRRSGLPGGASLSAELTKTAPLVPAGKNWCCNWLCPPVSQMKG